MRKSRHIYSKVVFLTVLVALAPGCLRRPLWIYTDEYRQVELITDWSLCDEQPDGMTAWFSKEDYSGQNRRITTAEVTHTWLNLPNGWWRGVVFDYSPAEYANQVFQGMTRPDSCYVKVRPANPQPVSSAANDQLFGTAAVPEGMDIPIHEPSGLYLSCVDPDPMNADTLRRVHIITGVDGDLILWEDQDTYESTLTTQTFYAYPQPITWKLRVFIQMEGINYLNSVKASIAGLADGNQLSILRHTPTVCLHPLNNWEIRDRNTSKNRGTIGHTIDTFGFPGPSDTGLYPSSQDDEEGVAFEADKTGKILQLNLQYLLRDEATLINYHFLTGYDGPVVPYDKDLRLYNRELKDEWISVYPDQRVIRIDIPIGEIILPYVDAKDSAGFDAEVSPWEDGDEVDIGF